MYSRLSLGCFPAVSNSLGGQPEWRDGQSSCEMEYAFFLRPDLNNEKVGGSFWNMKFIRYSNDLGACKSLLEPGNNLLEEKRMKK